MVSQPWVDLRHGRIDVISCLEGGKKWQAGSRSAAEKQMLFENRNECVTSLLAHSPFAQNPSVTSYRLCRLLPRHCAASCTFCLPFQTRRFRFVSSLFTGTFTPTLVLSSTSFVSFPYFSIPFVLLQRIMLVPGRETAFQYAVHRVCGFIES